MKSNTIASLFAFLALSTGTEAHTRFTTLHINGQSQGDGVCIRQDQNPGTTTNFVPSITGPEMACGIDGSITNPTTCSANAGDQISLEHREAPDTSQLGAIDVSHKGSTAIYMKKINSESDEVIGNGWFKIYFDGYDGSQWGTDHMNANNGLVTTNIPSDLASGLYLVRSEVLALQEVGEPQMYIGCAQLNLAGTSSAVPADTATIPGYIDMSTPAMNVNIYESFTFTEFGPKLYGTGGTGNGTAIFSVASTTSSTLPGGLAGATSGAASVASVGSSVTGPNAGGAPTVQSNDADAGDSNDDKIDVDDDNNDDDDDDDDGDGSENENSIGDKGDGEDRSHHHSHQHGSHHHSAHAHQWANWNNGKIRRARSILAVK